MSKLSRLARHFDDLAGQTVTTAYLYLSASPNESIKRMASLDSLDTTINTLRKSK